MHTVRIRTLKAMGVGLLASFLTAELAVVVYAVVDGFDARALQAGIFWVGFIGIVAGVFAIMGWFIFILPLTAWPQAEKLLGHYYVGEVVWMLLAVVAYCALVLSWAGVEAILTSWIPAVMGLLIGLSYRWLGHGKVKP
ncbi:hypothetical protein [Synoicihabitans lomoniglobus]|uniref:Uncharacterized protein n=1 Tax=Synoicihabitans lomoniglobus TaxID=2909285 RepID=A0AAE9ZX36_9BACT|nr:hypothetical protein [Opitutaceae bacterium LMO-M01]WED64495.1 hypothetical protein PXH66_19315 [Opitutaceae bacterium LMO-M01]